jgi:hypothetical protein
MAGKMRDTARQAYEIARDSGLLSERRMQVFQDICEHGPCTQLESWRRLSPNSNSGAITTRFSELERMDLIKTVGVKVDAFTKQSNTLWGATGDQPKKLERPINTNDYSLGYGDAIKSILETTKEMLAIGKIGYQVRVEIERICKEVAQ